MPFSFSNIQYCLIFSKVTITDKCMTKRPLVFEMNA